MALREGSVDRLSVAVVGCGYWGSNYVRHFAEDMRCRLVAVVDERPERLAAIRSKYTSVAASSDAAVVVEDPEIEAMAIATPFSTHYELCRAALEPGQHVVVAKPLAATTVDRLVRLLHLESPLARPGGGRLVGQNKDFTERCASGVTADSFQRVCNSRLHIGSASLLQAPIFSSILASWWSFEGSALCVPTFFSAVETEAQGAARSDWEPGLSTL